MHIFGACGRTALLSLVVAGAAALLATQVQAGGRIGTHGFGGLPSGTPGANPAWVGRAPYASSIIRHGGTGFSIYSQQGVTRVIGEPGVSRNVLLPNGQNARVVGDGRGGARVFGPGWNHRLIGAPSGARDRPMSEP